MVAAASFLGPRTARADDVFPLPAPSTTITIPPIDVAPILNALAQCPTVEVAPGVFVPVPCGKALKTVPSSMPTIDLPAAGAPLAVDLRNVGLDGPVKDQAKTGVCWAFAMSTTLEGSLRRSGRTDVLSALHVVAADAWDELFAADTAPREAIALDAAWPYDPIKACRFETGRDSCERAYGVATDSWRGDPQLVVERERARAMGVAAAGRAKRITNAKFGDSAVAALAQGQAVFLQMAIDSRTWSYKGLRSGVIPDWYTTDGGHAVTVVGYRTTPVGRDFLVHNSWGTGWGERGYAWIAEATIARHLSDALLFDAVGAGLKPPVVVAPPARPGPVAPAGCAAGTVFDVGAGRCVAPCPSGLAPAFGRCWLG
jgi:hypothetical protein